MAAEKFDGTVLSTPKVKLNINKNMYAVPQYFNGKKWVTTCINDKNSKYAKPVCYAIINGKEVSGFHLLEKSVIKEDVMDYLGKGIRYTVEAVDKNSLNTPVKMKLIFEFFEDHPKAIVMRGVFSVDGDGEYNIDRIFMNSLVLDAKATAKTKNSYDFCGYFGSGEIREHAIQELNETFRKDNYMGIYNTHDGGGARNDYRWGTMPGYGGGIPVCYLWQKNVGVGVCHIETKFKLCYIPVKVEKDKIVTMNLNYKTREKITKNSYYTTIKSAIILDQADYFGALSTYSKMIKNQGLHFPEGTNASYEPSWCSWGYSRDFTQKDILELLPSLKEIGIKWITIDDRWFDNVGDWVPREDMYPGGEEGFKKFIEMLHKEGFKVQLWTVPGMFDGISDVQAFLKDYPDASVEAAKHPYHKVSKFAAENPDAFITRPDGKKEITKRGYFFGCSMDNRVLKHFHELTKKMFLDWKIDGFKQDAIYICPNCYNEKHNHPYPEDAPEKFDELMRTIYETAISINPDAVIQTCPCGTMSVYTILQWQNQATTCDPWTSWITRSFTKAMKAVIGPRAAIYGDHIEIIDNGRDFASQVGVGAIPGTRYNLKGEDKTAQKEKQGALAFKNDPVTPEKVGYWKKWIGIYNEKMLSKGEYLNLYDLIYDKPETHVIKQNGKLYYSFYASEPDGLVEPWGGMEQYLEFDGKKGSQEVAFVSKHYQKMKQQFDPKFKGKVEFRGLEKNKTYKVYDYANNVKYPDIKGSNPFMNIDFTGFLLVELIEKKK
ncbi:MAG: hypothetical protein A2252_11755 [Elusimicrobia bacterium RIFOXYA2_FULL_39_19]|nr:MAG: hypothetical protein A2252_11755 [Elusimicrobia bacterium RIFOXYA2_FULL_39_19]